MPLDTLIYDASSCGYPRPRISPLPRALFSFLKPVAPNTENAVPTRNVRYFSRGRYALRTAYRIAGVGAGGALLAPAYHCRTMLDPAIELGAGVLLYSLTQNLAPDLASIAALADQSPTPVRALLVSHFFGFGQPLQKLAAWCKSRGIALIEDASHVLWTENHRSPGIGDDGDFVVSSPYKFCPSPDGGLLFARQAELLTEIQPSPPTWLEELRGAWRMRSLTADFRRKANTCRPEQLAEEYQAIVRQPNLATGQELQRQEGWSSDYHPEEQNRDALRLSRWIIRHSDADAIAKRRRQHYRQWHEALSACPNCQPLHPHLPDDIVPYMFPLLIEEPRIRFAHLKHLAVPVWRWDSMVAAACPVANDYRLRLIHLPCHQGLEPRQMAWLIQALTETLSTTTVGKSTP